MAKSHRADIFPLLFPLLFINPFCTFSICSAGSPNISGIWSDRVIWAEYESCEVNVRALRALQSSLVPSSCLPTRMSSSGMVQPLAWGCGAGVPGGPHHLGAVRQLSPTGLSLCLDCAPQPSSQLLPLASIWWRCKLFGFPVTLALCCMPRVWLCAALLPVLKYYIASTT